MKSNEFKKITKKQETRYVLENCSAGATGAGSVASSPVTLGELQRRLTELKNKIKAPPGGTVTVPPSGKPRLGHQKAQTGAGGHTPATRRDPKHKKREFERSFHEAAEKDTIETSIDNVFYNDKTKPEFIRNKERINVEVTYHVIGRYMPYASPPEYPEVEIDSIDAIVNGEKYSVDEYLNQTDPVYHRTLVRSLEQAIENDNYDPPEKDSTQLTQNDDYMEALDAALESILNEKAPPGEKYERMAKHIKAGYAKDGKLTPKEKSIAFATAWKAKKAEKGKKKVKSK